MLNEKQTQAINKQEGFVKVIAGPGAGKTRALTERYQAIVASGKATPAEIFCVTFTNKAAQEMTERIQSSLGAVGTPYIMTFHGFCAFFLREHIDQIGYPSGFKIADMSDQGSLLTRVYKRLEKKKKEYPLKEVQGWIKTGCKVSRLLVTNYEELLEMHSSAELWSRALEAENIEEQFILGYLAEQKRSCVLDFEDLLNFALYILRKYPRVYEKWNKYFKYVQVDEFQDVTQREFTLALMLAGRGNLFIVGDEDQSIYSFKGSKVQYMLKFKTYAEQFLGKAIPVTEIVFDENYRSTSSILDSTNALIHKNRDRSAKVLQANKGVGRKVLHYTAKTVYAEAQYLVTEIKKLLQEGYKYKDIVVLYRNNQLTRAVEEKFILAEYPYKIIAGKSFYERKEIRDMLAMLSLLAYEDDSSFSRVLSSHTLGIGKKKQEEIERLAWEETKSQFRTLILLAEGKKYKNTKALFLVEVVLKAREMLEETTLEEVMMYLYEQFEYEKEYKRKEEEDRWCNLQELQRSVRHYEQARSQKEETDAYTTLVDYLSAISLYAEKESSKEDTDYIRMMTIHASKGLEFEVVFLIGLNEGVLPSYRVVTKQDLEEERRIAYVACTRAISKLYLTNPGGTNYNREVLRPSRFLGDIGFNFLNTNLTEQAFGEIVKERREELENEGNAVMQSFAQLNPKRRARELVAGDEVTHYKHGEGIILSSTLTEYRVVFELKAAEPQVRRLSKKNSLLKLKL